MEIELWWLLVLPLFFALGWLAARVDIRQVVIESRLLPASYFKGLNFLLNEQPDKAIEAFIEVVNVNPQTIELHFALGSLFRRRGEVERAIRMHQHLAEREDLGQDQKLQALLELAQDYLKAGLLDRAEDYFSKLDGTAHAEIALGFLLEIYEQEKEWRRAIATAERLEVVGGRSLQKEIANFLCELAERELMQSRPEAARPLLLEALQHHRLCVRANLLLGDVEKLNGKLLAAITAWQQIESQSPIHLTLIAERLYAAYRDLQRPEEGLQVLRVFLEKYPSADLLETAYQATLSIQGVTQAYQLVRDEVRRTPTLLGLDKLLEVQLLEVSAERRNDLELAKQLIHQHTRNLAMYKCGHCGFRARQFYWHCPACSEWETYSPKRIEEKGLPA
jgi:lipopolysaccharide biosynthesis regulator YciM